MIGKRWLFLLTCAVAATGANAQSQFAGSWSGSITEQNSTTCTTNGVSTSLNCTVRFPGFSKRFLRIVTPA